MHIIDICTFTHITYAWNLLVDYCTLGGYQIEAYIESSSCIDISHSCRSIRITAICEVMWNWVLIMPDALYSCSNIWVKTIWYKSPLYADLIYLYMLDLVLWKKYAYTFFLIVHLIIYIRCSKAISLILYMLMSYTYCIKWVSFDQTSPLLH